MLVVKEKEESIQNNLDETIESEISNSCFCKQRDRVSITIRAPKGSYSGVETFKWACDIDNSYWKLPIQNIKVWLNQIVEFKSSRLIQFKQSFNLFQMFIDGVAPYRSLSGRNGRYKIFIYAN